MTTLILLVWLLFGVLNVPRALRLLSEAADDSEVKDLVNGVALALGDDPEWEGGLGATVAMLTISLVMATYCFVGGPVYFVYWNLRSRGKRT